MSGPNLSHPHENMTFACPKCDHARDLYQREDQTVKCYACQSEFPQKDLVERPTKRGCNLTPELASKGGKHGTGENYHGLKGTAQKRL